MKPWTIRDFQSELAACLPPTDRRPIVAFSALWPLQAGFTGEKKTFTADLLDALLAAVGPHRTLFMPTFTGGFENGFLDLDRAPGHSGALNELLRQTAGAIRSASAFFSFAGLGPEAETVAKLQPTDAWGDGSFYEWMERRDAHCLMIGVPATTCSFLHRMEWLRRDTIPYRYPKEFAGEILHRGQKKTLHERLFVRDEKSGAKNTFLDYTQPLLDAGAKVFPIGRGAVTLLGAKAMLAALLPFLDKDPFAFVVEPERLRAFYGQSPAADALR